MKPERRQQVRAEESRPLLAEIEAMLLQYLHIVLPEIAFGKALHYLHSQWSKLVRYVENGTWPISNNLCKNSIRPFVVGRRNFLFCNTVAGANAGANLYSIAETCKANGVDVYQYLVALFKALPRAQTVDDYEALLAWAVAASSKKTAIQNPIRSRMRRTVQRGQRPTRRSDSSNAQRHELPSRADLSVDRACARRR